MANIGEVIGNDMLIYVEMNDASGSTYWAPIAMGTNATLETSRDTIEISHKSSAKWKSFLTAQAQWTVSSENVYAYTDPYNASGITQDTVFDLLVSGTTVKVKLAGRSDGVFNSEESGDTYYEGLAIVTSISYAFPVNDVSTASIQLQGTSVLERKIVV